MDPEIFEKFRKAGEILANKVDKDDVMFFLGRKLAFNTTIGIKMAKMLKLGPGQMLHRGDYIIEFLENLPAYDLDLCGLPSRIGPLGQFTGALLDSSLDGIQAPTELPEVLLQRCNGLLTGVGRSVGLGGESLAQPDGKAAFDQASVELRHVDCTGS